MGEELKERSRDLSFEITRFRYYWSLSTENKLLLKMLALPVLFATLILYFFYSKKNQDSVNNSTTAEKASSSRFFNTFNLLKSHFIPNEESFIFKKFIAPFALQNSSKKLFAPPNKNSGETLGMALMRIAVSAAVLFVQVAEVFNNNNPTPFDSYMEFHMAGVNTLVFFFGRINILLTCLPIYLMLRTFRRQTWNLYDTEEEEEDNLKAIAEHTKKNTSPKKKSVTISESPESNNATSSEANEDKPYNPLKRTQSIPPLFRANSTGYVASSTASKKTFFAKVCFYLKFIPSTVINKIAAESPSLLFTIFVAFSILGNDVPLRMTDSIVINYHHRKQACLAQNKWAYSGFYLYSYFFDDYVKDSPCGLLAVFEARFLNFLSVMTIVVAVKFISLILSKIVFLSDKNMKKVEKSMISRLVQNAFKIAVFAFAVKFCIDTACDYLASNRSKKKYSYLGSDGEGGSLDRAPKSIAFLLPCGLLIWVCDGIYGIIKDDQSTSSKSKNDKKKSRFFLFRPSWRIGIFSILLVLAIDAAFFIRYRFDFLWIDPDYFGVSNHYEQPSYALERLKKELFETKEMEETILARLKYANWHNEIMSFFTFQFKERNYAGSFKNEWLNENVFFAMDEYLTQFLVYFYLFLNIPTFIFGMIRAYFFAFGERFIQLIMIFYTDSWGHEPVLVDMILNFFIAFGCFHIFRKCDEFDGFEKKKTSEIDENEKNNNSSENNDSEIVVAKDDSIASVPRPLKQKSEIQKKKAESNEETSILSKSANSPSSENKSPSTFYTLIFVFARLTFSMNLMSIFVGHYVYGYQITFRFDMSAPTFMMLYIHMFFMTLAMSLLTNFLVTRPIGDFLVGLLGF